MIRPRLAVRVRAPGPSPGSVVLICMTVFTPAAGPDAARRGLGAHARVRSRPVQERRARAAPSAAVRAGSGQWRPPSRASLGRGRAARARSRRLCSHGSGAGATAEWGPAWVSFEGVRATSAIVWGYSPFARVRVFLVDEVVAAARERTPGWWWSPARGVQPLASAVGSWGEISHTIGSRPQAFLVFGRPQRLRARLRRTPAPTLRRSLRVPGERGVHARARLAAAPVADGLSPRLSLSPSLKRAGWPRTAARSCRRAPPRRYSACDPSPGCDVEQQLVCLRRRFVGRRRRLMR